MYDPVEILREKLGERRPVHEWEDELFEQLLQADPLALNIAFVAERVRGWETPKRHLHHARMAIAGVLNEAMTGIENTDLNGLRGQRELLGIMATRLTRICTHEMVELAVELDGPNLWEWCVRCGILKGGDKLYRPGPHQKKELVGA